MGSTVELLVGLRLNAVVYDWIRAAWAGRQQPRSGEVIPHGAPEKIVFTEATITETRLPTLDSRAGEAAVVMLELRARSLRRAVSSPVDQAHPLGPKQQLWLRSNFVLEIGGVDCSRVSAISSFGIGTANPSAASRLPIIEVRFAPQSLASWKEWQAAPASQPRRDGVIRFLATNLQTELAHIRLVGVKLVRLHEPVSAPSDRIVPVVASISSTGMQLVGPALT